jgi:hypothetical protein
MVRERNGIRYSWHLLFISGLFLFLYGIAVYDYLMTVTHNQDYFEYLRYDQAVIDYFTNYPSLPLVFWTINVFIGVLTPVLMLMRKAIAFYASVVAFVAMLLLDVITFGFRDRWNVIGARASSLDLLMLLLTFGLCLYTHFLFRKSDP